MINTAHASRFHWEVAGTALKVTRGAWQIAGFTPFRAEACLYPAERCLRVTLENNLQDFGLAFACEAMARACDLTGDEVEAVKYITLAQDAGAETQDPGDRDYFFQELHTLQPDPD